MACVALMISITIIVVANTAAARELRPSDHGLEYQSRSPVGENSAPEMEEFFGTTTAAATTPSSSNNNHNVALPKATSYSDDDSWWKKVTGNDGESKGGERLRHVLLVASIACGVTGAVLLVASGFVYFVKYGNKKSTIDNSKAIVIRK